jgi:glutamate/tyrosine decarboxylase-like PLP-dependent enzyme
MDDLRNAASGKSLDPDDWDAVRRQAHVMLDDMLSYVQRIRERPVWQPIPDDVRARFRAALPRAPSDLGEVYREFADYVLPYTTGNVHPGFMGWVHGGGNVAGMLAEMLAGGLNANLGGRDHVPIEVERQIVEWARQMFAFPQTASGVFVTGTSMANFLAVVIARTVALGPEVRREGLAAAHARLVAYTSRSAHGCVRQAMELSGLGSAALRIVETDAAHRISVPALKAAIASDRSAGLAPFLVVGTAGSVDVGAIDDLAALAQVCRDEKVWFHIDGAFGALGVLAADIAPRLAGIERADSIAFDFHKWGQVPYDAGFLIVRDGTKHRAAFASPAAYLRRETRGLAAGSPWPCDFGPDLSRGFRALKTWFTLKTYGTERLGSVISRTCAVARYLESRVRAEQRLELLAPAQLNIVCFRYRSDDADGVNARIIADLHESGIAAPSATTVNGNLAIRACIVNHRTQPRDLDALVDATLEFGARPRAAAAARAGQ